MKTKFTRGKLLLVIFTLIFASFNLKAALCNTTGNGDWANAATWSCGHVPTCGDSIVIKAGHIIDITSQVNLSACPQPFYIRLQGTLNFKAGSKLRLPCGSIIWVYPGGTVQDGGGGGASNTIEICGDTWWQASDPPLTGPTCIPPTNPICGATLPIELISFTGEAKDGYIDLAWMTATETNNCCFEIQRSLDASSFNKISSVNSKAINGNSQSVLKYSTSDNSPISSISYYRLKQIDKDNTSEFSGIIAINYIKGKNIKFVVYPNPNKGEFTADISGIENDHEITISLKDEKGDVVYNSKFFIQDAGSSKLNIIPQSKLTNGLYICTLTLEGIEYNVKVIVN